MQSHVREYWQVSKPAVSSDSGLVASQHHLASDVGARVLKEGGNAIDAAVATGLALGTVEPWMSGIGGGGYMTIYLAKEKTVKVVEFAMRGPFNSSPDDYPLAEGGKNSSDAFDWPKVVDDVNIHGPLSIAVPGYLKGIDLAVNTFGTRSFADLIEPACQLAEWGLPIDWYSAGKINSFARDLNRYDTTRGVYLADGLPPRADIVNGTMVTLPLGQLATTYRRLQNEGGDTFYLGQLGDHIVSDLQATGSRITKRDLEQYQAKIADPLQTAYRDCSFNVAGELTAGPSIIQALGILAEKLVVDPGATSQPDIDTYVAFAESLFDTYEYRLSHLGQGPSTPTNTTHVCVADSEGNVVSLTQTIMSGFGSRIMLPQSGILMNNGMMWFDPRPGGPNSVEGGRFPLCNMCPVIGVMANGSVFAAGACGGRKIFPAVFQLTSFLVDYQLSAGDAAHVPRIDVSGNEWLTIMDTMPGATIAALESQFSHTRVRPNGVSPNFFALPQVIVRDSRNEATGACFIPSPHAKVSAAG